MYCSSDKDEYYEIRKGVRNTKKVTKYEKEYER